MPKDISGRELAEGDEVAYMVPYVKKLRLGVVVGITPKMVHVDEVNPKERAKYSRRTRRGNQCVFILPEKIRNMPR